ncbi:DUF3347 domain-containing protein [Gramella sp. GC03-9]|uniref:DUF3347 domain-containing protein n=1 Tax=Christiangramia oceanisediminis TaxID=2920386 RepID=A0A9X2I2A1_9FLAO|nr:DUF3347 domain-containing protein [Gramella oceanisediminis]MCP9199691.1 DUF3347 domain-containing protein [Gramella oceanisediminis]
MKKRVNSLFVLALAGMLSFTSCKDNKEAENEPAEPMQHEMHQADTEMDHEGDMMDQSGGEMAMAEFSDENSSMMYQHYLEIKDALVATDAAAAKKAAGNMAGMMEEKNDISSIAENIASIDDVNKQRELFSELTAAMEPALKEAITSGKIYKQYCPMAFEGKGDYWYSNSDQIRNPYYGDKMLKCGRVEETIE